MNLYLGYETYVASFRMQFGIAVTSPSFEEYVKFYTVNQLSTASVETNPAEKELATAKMQQQTGTSGKTKRERWGEDQARVLVYSWKTHFGLVESHKSNVGWIKIQTEVNANEPPKSVKQCKDKLRNLKDAYKAACNNNKQTGADPKFSPFFDTFDEIFGTRDVINMPDILDSGHGNRRTEIDNNHNINNNNSYEEDEAYDVTNEHSNESDNNASLDVTGIEEEENDLPGVSNDVKVPGTPKQLRKSAKNKRKREGKAGFREELIDLQKRQLDAFKEQTASSEEAMQKMFEKQLKHEEREREKDRQLLLQLGQIMSQK